MKIGELANRAGVGVDTVRYYERQGLLPPPARRASGYRCYEASDVARLRFVRRAKSLGFSLMQVAELLALSHQRGAGMADVKDATARKLAEVDAKLAELTRIREGLDSLLNACPGEGALDECPILNALAQEPQ